MSTKKWDILIDKTHKDLKEKLCEGKVEEDRMEAPCEESPPKIEEKTNNFCKYVIGDNNKFFPSKKVEFTKTLPPGMYTLEWDDHMRVYAFVKTEIVTDELIMLPDGIFETILKDLDFFWKNKPKFDEYGFNFKRGILLYGEPGNGKSCLTALISNQVMKLGGVIFNIRSARDLDSYINAIPNYFKFIQPTTPILTIIEDLDGLSQKPDDETALLNILDGFFQMDNCVYLGCTNYPEKIKERILNRPSRFDKRYHITLPDRKVRKFYLEQKIDKNDKKKYDINKIADKTEGLSIAHLGELIKSVFIFGKSIEASIKELKKMKDYISSSNFEGSETKGIGFRSEECKESDDDYLVKNKQYGKSKSSNSK